MNTITIVERVNRAHDDGPSSMLRASDGTTTVVSSYWDEDHEHAVALTIERKVTTGSWYAPRTYDTNPSPVKVDQPEWLRRALFVSKDYTR